MEASQIRDLRKRMDLTQQQFAGLLGVSFVTLNRWENGQSKPSAMGLAKLQQLSARESGPAGDWRAASDEVPIDQRELVRLDFLGEDVYKRQVNYWGNFNAAGYNFDPDAHDKPLITTRVTIVSNENTPDERQETVVVPLRRVGDLTFVRSLRYGEKK